MGETERENEASGDAETPPGDQTLRTFDSGPGVGLRSISTRKRELA